MIFLSIGAADQQKKEPKANVIFLPRASSRLASVICFCVWLDLPWVWFYESDQKQV